MKIMGKNRMIIIKCIEKIGWIMTKISPCCEARYKPSLIKWRSSSTCSHGLDPAATCRADFRVFSTMEGSYIRYLSTVNRKSCQGLKIKPNHCKFCHMSFFAGVSNIWVGNTNCLRLHWRGVGKLSVFNICCGTHWTSTPFSPRSTISISKLCETESPKFNTIQAHHTIYIQACVK